MSRPQRSEDLSHEREVLEEMVRSEGWQVFIRRLQLEWRGDGYFSRMGLALKDPDPNMARVIHATSLEIEKAIQWPVDRVKFLGGRVE